MTQDDQTRPARSDAYRASGTNRLAAHVISVLQKRQMPKQQGVRQFIFDYLVRAVVYQPEFVPDLVLAELRGFRLNVDTIIDVYVPAVARHVGEMWVQSDVNFAQVTIAALRLQSVLSEATRDYAPVSLPSTADLTLLFVVPEGEQHFLGASVATAQLRRLGCNVNVSFGETDETIVARLVQERHDAVLFTCARTVGLETIAQTVFSVSNLVRPAPLLFLGGAIVGDKEHLMELTGVDEVTNTTTDVVSLCLQKRKDTADR